MLVMELLKDKIPDIIYNKLLNIEIHSLEQLLTINNGIFEQNFLTFLEIEELKEVISELLVAERFQSALEISNCRRLRTSNNDINEILRGGVPVQGINEIYGPSGVGKTQLCLELAIMAQLPIEVGGLNKDVLYICTEDPFPSKRMHELGKLLPSKILCKEYTKSIEDRIYVDHLIDFEQLSLCITTRLRNLLSFANIGLVIIDSIAGVFRSYNQNIDYVTRKDQFKIIAEALYKLIDRYEMAVVCVNQVVDDVTTGKTEPCLGLAWGNYVTSRFSVSRIDMTSIRKFEVIFSPDLPPKQCYFQIYPDGLGAVDK